MEEKDTGFEIKTLKTGEDMEELSSDNATALKLEINRLIWQYASPTMTLREAEDLAVDFYRKVTAR